MSPKPAGNLTASSNDGIPKGFRLTSKGLYYRLEVDDGSSEWVWVCSPLKVVALTRNADGQDWGRLLQLVDADEVEHSWAMPMSLLAGDGTDLRSMLLSMGLTISPNKAARKRLSEYLSTAKPSLRARCVDRVGWHGSTFILADEVFGDQEDERVLLQSATTFDHAYKISGNLFEWTEKIGSLAIGNSRLAFALSAAFAPPLLALNDEESGGFHFRGGSSIGKTTLIRLAGSVWGGGGIQGYLKQWRATANGLEGVALAHCDALLCLDELSQVDGQEAGQVAYMLANGQGKSRARRNGQVRPSAQWRTLFLSTGEMGLAEKIQETGQRAWAGQEVRVIDIQANAGAGLGVFEELHDEPNGDALARSIRELTNQSYGSPIREFLSMIASDPQGTARLISKAKEAWLNKYCPEGADGQVKRVTARFALVAAAGKLAVDKGLLPWPEDLPGQAANTCFQSWLENRGTDGPSEIAAGIAQVRHFFEAHGDSRFQPWDSKNQGGRTINRVGFYKRNEKTDEIEFWIFPDSFKDEIASGLDAKLLLRALIEGGYLEPESSNHLAKSVRVPALGKTARLYHFNSSIIQGDGQ